MVRLDSQQFQEAVAEEELTVIHGIIKSRWRGAPRGYYYIASNGMLTYYLRVSEPVYELFPNIIADEIRIQLKPPQQYM